MAASSHEHGPVSPEDPQCTEDASVASFPLIVAIDVGQKNLSLCAMRLYISSPNTWALLTEARERLRKSTLERWEVVNLNPNSRTQSFVERSSAIADFVQHRAALFAEASVVIIEHQMHSLMRSMAAALFACINIYAKNARLLSQHSSSKLQWKDIVECTGCGERLQQYNQRKKVAVKCAEFLLDLPSGLAAKQRALLPTYADESPTIVNMRRTFQATAKRDDLADALLHLLVCDRSTKPIAKKRRLA